MTATSAGSQIDIDTRFGAEQNDRRGYLTPDLAWVLDLATPFTVTGIRTIIKTAALSEAPNANGPA